MNTGPEDVLPSTNDGNRGGPVASARCAGFFQRSDWLSFNLTTAAAFLIYVMTLAPEVTLEFSGIEATGARYAAVPHPPGFVLWTLYAWIFTILLPVSNVAWRVAVSSAIAGAIAAGVVALMVSRGGLMILEGIGSFRRLLPAQAENRLRATCGFVAGLGFALHRIFWSQSVIVETYALGTLVFALTLCLLMRWTHDPDAKRYLHLAAFMYGLTLTVSLHLAAAAMGLVCIVLFRNPALGRDLLCATAVYLAAVLVLGGVRVLPMVISGFMQLGGLWVLYLVIAIVSAIIVAALSVRAKRVLTEWRTVGAIILLLGTGLSLYFYTAIASMTNPPMNWGYARTVDGFIHLVSRGQYEGINATNSLGLFIGQVGQYAFQTAKDLGLIYLVPAMVPFWYVRKLRVTERAWMLGLLATFLCLSLLLLALLNPPPDSSSQEHVAPYFIGSHLILSIWAGYGLIIIGTKVGSLRKC